MNMTMPQIAKLAVGIWVAAGLLLFLGYALGIENDPKTGILGAYLLLFGNFLLQQWHVAQQIGKLEKEVEELRAKTPSAK